MNLPRSVMKLKLRENFSKNDFRLDGIFNGKLTCEKSIIIGKNAVFKGQLNCKNLVINGYHRG